MRASSSPSRAPSSTAVHVERLLERHPADVHQAAEHVGREPGALLVGEERHRDRVASVAMPCCSSVSITSSPASTPRLPSKRPPVRTVSMCEPVITGAAVGSRPGARGDDVADRIDARRRGRGRASSRPPGRGPRGRRRSSASRAQPRSPFGPMHGADLAERLDARPRAGRCRSAASLPVVIVSDRSRTRRSRPAPRRTPSTAAVEQLGAALGRGERRIADVRRRAPKSLDSHPKPTLPPKRT